MARVVPEALAELFPALSPIVVEAPLVQVMSTEPAASSGVVAWATSGSYAPNASVVEVIVQLLVTLAVTLKFDVAVAASAGAAKARIAAAASADTSRPWRRCVVISFSLR